MRWAAFVGVMWVAGCGRPLPPPEFESSTQEVVVAQPQDDGSCMAAHQQVLTDVAALMRTYATGCTADADCVLVEADVSCQSLGCRPVVLVAQRSAFVAALASYDAATCPSLPTGCGFFGLCGLTGPAECSAGVCRQAMW